MNDAIQTTTFLRVLLGALLLVLLMALLSFGLSTDYDWDIDHEMYFGGRLLEGELIWTREFHDKLPLVPFLFVLPAALGSVAAWNAFSAFALAAAALFLWRQSRTFLATQEMGCSSASRLGLAAAMSFVYLNLFLPGSLTVINSLAAVLVLVSTVLWLAAFARSANGRVRLVTTLLLCTLLASLAISIRPYFLLASLLVPTWAILRLGARAASRPDRSSAAQTAALGGWTALWGLGLLAWGLLLNVMPYALTGEMEAFRNGLVLLGQDLNPQSTLSVLLKQARDVASQKELVVLLVAGSLLLGVLAIHHILRPHRSPLPLDRRATVDALFAAVVSPLAVGLMITGKHFWPHYLQFFSPYWALSLLLLGAAVLQRLRGGGRTIPLVLALAVAVVTVVLLRREVAGMAVRLADFAAGESHPWADRLALFEVFLEERRTQGLSTDFLHPTHMYFHWQLDEPRWGFPHAANTMQVFEGWWSEVEVPAGFELPTSAEHYCALLDASGPSIVVEEEASSVQACLRNSDVYDQEGQIAPGVGDAALTVYVRS